MTSDVNSVDWNFPAIERVLARCPEVPAHAADQLFQYAQLLYHWSGKMSLISAGDRPHLIAKHLIPCLAMVPFVVSHRHKTIVDFGSGGGLPGIPIQIMLPESAVILVESRRKRVSFLREVTRTLKLKRAKVVHGRLADWPGIDERDAPVAGADLVVARAVGDPATVFAETQSIMAAHGRLIVTSKPGQTKVDNALGFESHKVAWDGGEQWLSTMPKQSPSTGLSTVK